MPNRTMVRCPACTMTRESFRQLFERAGSCGISRCPRIFAALSQEEWARQLCEAERQRTRAAGHSQRD